MGGFFDGVLIIVNEIQLSKGDTISPLLNDRRCNYLKYVCTGLLVRISHQ